MKWRHAYSFILPMLLMGCSDLVHELLTDPAVRIATCIESGAASLAYNDKLKTLNIECDSKLNGEYVVLFAPSREYTDEELLEKGFSVGMIRKFRQHINNNPSNGLVYVIPRFTQEAGSHSTAYGQNVKISRWLMTNKKDHLVHIELTKHETDTILISNIR